MAKAKKKPKGGGGTEASPLAASLLSEPASDGGSDAGSADGDYDAPPAESASDDDDDGRRGGGGSGREMSKAKLEEEAALTARLFGGSMPSSSGAAWQDDDDDDDDDAPPDGDGRGGDGWSGFGGGGGDLFAIDRSGEDVDGPEDAEGLDGEEDGEEDGGRDRGRGGPSLNANDSDGGGSTADDRAAAGPADGASMRGAAWRDSDGEDSVSDSDDEPLAKKHRSGVSLTGGPNRLRKLRRHAAEDGAISLPEYEMRLRERYASTAGAAARTDWADVSKVRREGIRPSGESKRRADDSDDDSDYGDDTARDILESNASLFDTSSSGRPLPPTLLDIVRTRDANLAEPNGSVVSSLQFHPGSSEDDDGNLLLMTAGMDKMLRFFRVDGESNPKVHGVHFPKMPIMSARFLGDTGSVVLSGRRPFFYVYDAVSGKVQKIPSIAGRKERSLEKFAVSPDGSLIAFVGNDGYVILVDGQTRKWVGDLKMNGSVRAVEFSRDGEHVMGSGSDGDVYRWHIGSRRCVERFHNQDGTITSSLAASDGLLAVGAESGVVNLYDGRSAGPARRPGGGLALAATDRTPLKSVMNLTTSADFMKFSADGQILAMSTRREHNGLKLLHVPSRTVFSNWPTSKTPLKYVWGVDFSPGGGYLAVGNDRGKCLLYKLRHYWEE